MRSVKYPWDYSKWATPGRIEMVDEIAKTSVGKIDKKRLRAQIIKPHH